MELTAPTKEKTGLPTRIKSFLAGWSLIIMLAWFGSLWIVTGLLGLRQDDQAWQLYSLLLVVALFGLRPLFLVMWLRRQGFKYLPVRLPPNILYLIIIAIMGEALLLLMGGFFIERAFDFSLKTFMPLIILVNTMYLVFEKDKQSKSKHNSPYWVFVFILLFVAYIVLSFIGYNLSDALAQQATVLPFPFAFISFLGFSISLIMGAVFTAGLFKWMTIPGWRNHTQEPKRGFERFLVPALLVFIVGFLILLSFLFPSNSAILNGLRPCGWIDQRLSRSACIGRWQSYGGNQGLLSSDGEHFVEYESYREYTVSRPALRISSLQGQILNELSLETFSPDTFLDIFYYLPERELLAFTVIDSGIFIWDVPQDSLIALPARSAYDRLRDLFLTSDGKSLITVAQGGISVWRIEDQQEIAQLDTQLDGLKDVQVYAGTSEIYLLFDNGVTASWDFATDELLQIGEKIEYTDGLFETAFIGENETSYIVTAKDNELLLWPSKGEVVHLLDDASLNVNLTNASIVVSPDGRTLLASGYNWMQVWRVSDGTNLLATKTCLYNWDCSGNYRASLSNTGVIARFNWEEIQIWSLVTEID